MRKFQINQNGRGTVDSATVIDVRDLDRTYPINVQLQFASVDAAGNPVLPFSPVWPFLGGGEKLDIIVRRGTDPNAGVVENDFTLQSFGTQAGDVWPFDVITARTLGIECRFSNGGAGADAIWVQAIATIVDDVATRDKVIGWPTAISAGAGGFIAAVATPGNALLLRQHAQRAQFFIVNTSTNADLLLGFGQAPSWAGPTGNLILPANTAATYESPVGGFRGEVRGSWNNGAPNGGALVTEGLYYP
jgi:hypothetical protein